MNYQVSIEYAGDTALSLAASANHQRVALILLKAGANADVATHGNLRPIHFAAANGNMTLVDLLINSGANVTVVDGEKLSDIAAHEGHYKLGMYLLKLECEVAAKFK